MSNFINGLLYGFTNILSVGPEQPREGEGKENEGCSGSNGGGCCKDKPTEQPAKEKSGCCQGDNAGDACCSSSATVIEPVAPKKEDGCCQSTPGKSSCACESEPTTNEPVVIDNLKIIFSTLTGTAKTMATEIEAKIQANDRVTVHKIEIMDITEYDNDNLLQETAVCVFILSTYNVEGPLDW